MTTRPAAAPADATEPLVEAPAEPVPVDETDAAAADDNSEAAPEPTEAEKQAEAATAAAEHDVMLAQRGVERAERQAAYTALPPEEQAPAPPKVTVEVERGPSTGVAPYNVNGVDSSQAPYVPPSEQRR